MRTATVPMDRQLLAASLAPLVLAPAELEELAAAIEQPPPPAIRLRRDRPSLELPFATSPVPWHPQGRFVKDAVRPGAQLEFAAADYYIQDAASLLALAVLDPQADETLCDLCAAPGGKATAILETLGDQGWLLANETVQSRRGVLEFNLARHGVPRYMVSGFDPAALAARCPERFDAVLVDAPCSGQSLLGRGKQTLSAFLPNTVEHCAARQIRILDAAAALVRPGGRLVYSTCTFAYAENEGQIELFLQRHPDWVVESPGAATADRGMHGYGMRLWPHRQPGSGGYACRLRRADDSTPAVHGPLRTSPVLAAGNLPAEVRDWGQLAKGVVRHSSVQCFGWPEGAPADLLGLALSGPEVAFRKGSTWFPAYALAMRGGEGWQAREQVELPAELARDYVRGQVVPGAIRGWGVAAWKTRPLGWVKGDGRQLKNHLPKGARMQGGGDRGEEAGER